MGEKRAILCIVSPQNYVKLKVILRSTGLIASYDTSTHDQNQVPNSSGPEFPRLEKVNLVVNT